MSSPVPGPQANHRDTRASGFTLIELVVVIFIIGLMLSMVGLSIPSSPDSLLDSEAARLEVVMKMAQDEALLSGNTIALVTNDSQYRFFRRLDGKWQPTGVSGLRGHQLPVSVWLDQHQPNTSDRPDNLALFFSTGEASAASIEILHDSGGQLIELRETGEITRSRLE